MQASVRNRILLFGLSLFVVATSSYLVILFARGYRPNISQKSIDATGLLFATSVPDAAQVYLNGTLSTATNGTLNLPPGAYQIEIKKESYQPWKKMLTLENEIVTKASALLFPTIPSLKAVSTSGASIPTLSPDGSKAAFVFVHKLYILDLSESALGLIAREPKLISNLPASRQVSNLVWSPDSRQILAIATRSAQLIDTNTSQISTIASPSALVQTWKKRFDEIELQKFSELPDPLQEILLASAANFIWSPKENKLLYVATASAEIPVNLKKQLPGSNTQVQDRNLDPNNYYVYDLEEDRNFKLTGTKFIWYPDSSHLIKVENQTITILEYDNQNHTTIYPGPMTPNFVLPYPSGKQLLILTNLTPTTNSLPNLYAISLR